MLTMIRMAMIPVYVILYVAGQRVTALVVFIFAGSTDFLDGYLARKYNQITAFGKLMDPIADKGMVITVMLSQTLTGIIPPIAVILLCLKESVMIVGSYLMLKKKDIVTFASPIGKIAQTSFCISLGLTFFHTSFESMTVPWDMVTIWISLGLTLVAMVYYVVASLIQVYGQGDGKTAD